MVVVVAMTGAVGAVCGATFVSRLGWAAMNVLGASEFDGAVGEVAAAPSCGRVDVGDSTGVAVGECDAVVGVDVSFVEPAEAG